MVINHTNPFDSVENRRLYVNHNIIFGNAFNEEFLKRYFIVYLRKKNIATGIDRITSKKFLKSIITEVEIISLKVTNKTYRFSNYRGVAINKGYNKYPRIISIPTVRDYLVFSIINDYLKCFYESKLAHQELVQTKVASIIKYSLNYSDYYKFDLKCFFDSIPHETLINKLRGDNIDPTILFLIEKALKKQTLLDGELISNHSQGVFQGLPIANILAEIFMIDIDTTIANNFLDCKYFRYVDDILLMTNPQANISNVSLLVENIVKSSGLCLNTAKTKTYSNNDSFEYLGYVFNKNNITLSTQTIQRFESRLELLFKKFAKNNEPASSFILLLNLRITGFVIDNKKYGWLFYHSQINDLTLLYHLDLYIQKLLVRFNLEKHSLKVKKFIRAYNEIIFNLRNTKYMVNFNTLNDSEIKKLLVDYFSYDEKILNLSTDELKQLLNKEINQLKKIFEEDTQHIS